jgi:hypothetical protein
MAFCVHVAAEFTSAAAPLTVLHPAIVSAAPTNSIVTTF